MLHISSDRKRYGFRPSHQELALVGITVLWGASFLISQTGVHHSGPLLFVGTRFLIAGIITSLLFLKTMRGVTLRELGAGATIGLSICLGCGLQTYGLQSISSSQSAFLTALYVPVVPLMQWFVLRKPPHVMSWAGIGLAFTGLILLAGPGAYHVGSGSGVIATLLGTVAMAAEIILISRFAPLVDSRRITVVQLLCAGLFSLAFMPFAGETVPSLPPIWIACAAGLGIASVVIQLTMNWAQKVVSPTRATVIYAGEPVWGGIVGRLAGDSLPSLALLGGAFIIAGVIASEWRPKFRRVPDHVNGASQHSDMTV
ncbi:DMT family transporter [Acetobacter oeni]|uniref:Membrane protein n=1 Tax=Acetobacter oeni TaxID=304077 RepID=A0A511XFY3_9PROT|nr:DMT family transporter [Acetobacter oeni]MBB3882231.1 drug/metabolite transporter (DMT)-like permease [Acetobacter oeni]NHO17987.1 EamA family transporter [Acetobacter oeni]GEN61849.1 membrane protein [Acetobacter oeni]